MDKALALESSGLGSNPCEGEILFTEEAWKKWARFVIYKKVNKEKGGNHYQTDFISDLIFSTKFEKPPKSKTLPSSKQEYIAARVRHALKLIIAGKFKHWI